jgi:serine phosphatase RsbU (regulator of sigma subunit)
MIGEDVIGTINVWMDKPYKAKSSEIDLLSSISSHAAVVMANAKLFSREYQIAETLQSNLIGAVPETFGRLTFGHKYLPALDEANVGGDLCDVIPLPNGKVGLIVADITGKGIKAAVHTAMIRYMGRAFIFQWPDSPAAVLGLLNKSIFCYFGSTTIVTVFCAIIDPETGWMSYANAGHPPAIILTRGGKQQILLYRTGIPIGYSADSDYDERESMLSAGDVLLLYTDGIIDARKNQELLAIEGLQDIIFQHSHLGPSELVDAVCEEVGRFTGNEFKDDIAMIATALDPQIDRQPSDRGIKEGSAL